MRKPFKKLGILPVTHFLQINFNFLEKTQEFDHSHKNLKFILPYKELSQKNIKINTKTKQ